MISIASRDDGGHGLPKSPHAIHHAVVSPKCRIPKRSIEIAPWITSNNIVNAAMRADFDRVWNTL